VTSRIRPGSVEMFIVGTFDDYGVVDTNGYRISANYFVILSRLSSPFSNCFATAYVYTERVLRCLRNRRVIVESPSKGTEKEKTVKRSAGRQPNFIFTGPGRVIIIESSSPHSVFDS